MIVLCQWKLDADYLDEDYMSGLMPILFVSDAESAERGLRENVTSIMKDLDRLNRIFFSPETVDLETAFAIVKKPRAGEADYVFKNRNLDRLFEAPLQREKGTDICK